LQQGFFEIGVGGSALINRNAVVFGVKSVGIFMRLMSLEWSFSNECGDFSLWVFTEMP